MLEEEIKEKKKKRKKACLTMDLQLQDDTPQVGALETFCP